MHYYVLLYSKVQMKSSVKDQSFFAFFVTNLVYKG